MIQTEVTFPPPVDVDDIRQHVRETLPSFYKGCPQEVMVLANDVQPMLRAYDELRAENERLRAALIQVLEISNNERHHTWAEVRFVAGKALRRA